MKREEQGRMLEERLVAAVADEYRYGAICDLDYGGRPEKERELLGAEGRAQEIREIARDFCLELPARADVDERARAAVREEYEGAAATLADLVARTAADPYALFNAEQRANDAGPVLRYLDDVEERLAGEDRLAAKLDD